MDYLLHHTLRKHAESSPEKEALVRADRRLNYRELWESTCRLAGGLQSEGLTRGERVGILLEPSVEQVVSIYAAIQSQGVFVPIHHSLQVEQVRHICSNCDVSVLITTSGRWSELRHKLCDLPALKSVIVVGDDHADEAIAYDQLVTQQNATPCDDLANEKDLAGILYTSGSTGKPKGVMLSHANVIAGASIVSDYLSITSGDRLLAVLPFTFDAGLNQLTTAIQQGGTIVLSSFRFGRDVVKELQREKITGLAGVPPFWNMLIQPSNGLRDAEFECLRYITNTGGAMPQSTLAALREFLPGTDVFLMYGLTEAFRSTYLPPEELDRRPTSIGKAIPNTEILVLNEEGECCGPGETGELVHHGPTVSMGYWGRDDLTAEILRPHPCPPPGTDDAMKVCYSGDLVTIDEEGFLFFAGRRDNLIKSAGFRLSPTEVEQVICRAPEVCESAVVGVPDELLGQSVHAFAVLAEDYDLPEVTVIDQCAAVLPRYMVPRHVVFLDKLPKTTSGKIDYPCLRDQAIAMTKAKEPVTI